MLRNGIAVFFAIGKMSDCDTIESCRPHSELVGGGHRYV